MLLDWLDYFFFDEDIASPIANFPPFAVELPNHFSWALIPNKQYPSLVQAVRQGIFRNCERGVSPRGEIIRQLQLPLQGRISWPRTHGRPPSQPINP